MKFFLALTIISSSLMAHESALPHNHAADGVQLAALALVLLFGLVLFAVLKKTA